MARSKRNKASNIETQNNPPISSSDQQTHGSGALNNMESQQHSNDQFMPIIKIQDKNI